VADITFYTNPQSRGQITRWMLEELGEPYDTIILDYDRGLKSPEYLAINPMGKVPAIRHKDVVVTEGAAICAYLADAFPAAGLAPPLGPRRGPYYRWLFFAAGPFEAAVTGKALGLLAPPERARSVGYGTFEDTIAALETAVAGADFICGDQFTAADVYVGAHIAYARSFGLVPESQVFADYVARIEQRPARKRAQELDQAAIAAEPA
jgi:glutathione S-transferase